MASKPPLDAAGVEALHRKGQEQWPDLAVDRDAFARHLARVSAEAPPSIDHAADLYLACACALEVPGAIAAFEQTYGADLARAVARIHGESAFVADAVQAVRERLLMRRGDEPPRIGDFAGRSALRTWLASAAARVALNLRRGLAEQPHLEVQSDLAVSGALPVEMAMLRARYKNDLEASIAAALRSLSPRDRTLLRLHLAQRMSIDGIGAAYKVGRSTAARWLAAAREALGEETKRHFCQRVGLPPAEFDSIAAALRSDLDVSLVTHLASADDMP
jgi:RNA polymerase sigma-70 factor (ECF subfamily)